jgi:hypothetical protein
MGNTIVKDDLLLNTDTDLGKFIQNWALNNYTIHPEAKGDKFKDSLKKRACCTWSPTVGIGIAGVNDLTKPTKIDQYRVNIAPFNGDNGKPSKSPNVINSSNCKLDDDTGTAQNFYQDNADKKFINSQPACANFYKKSTSGASKPEGFADYVLRNRSNDDTFPLNTRDVNLKTDTSKLYSTPLGNQILGLTPDLGSDSVQGNNGGKLNPYPDVNCINSVYQVHSALFKDAQGNQIDPQKLAQTNDSKCTLNSTIAWKGTDSSVSSICFNMLSVGGNISAADAGAVDLKQSCNAGQQPAAQPAPTQQPAAQPAPTQQPAAQPAPTQQPAAQPAQPAAQPAPTQQPAAQPAQPAAQPAQPAAQQQPAPTQQPAAQPAQPAAQPAQPAAQQQPAAIPALGISNTMMVYIGIGVAVLIIFILIMVFMMSGKKHNDEE